MRNTDPFKPQAVAAEAVFIRDSVTNEDPSNRRRRRRLSYEDPPNAQQPHHRPKPQLKGEEVVVLFCVEYPKQFRGVRR